MNFMQDLRDTTAPCKKYDRGLEESVDFGTFTALGRLILSVLNRLKALTGNYGVSIILLTIGLQLLMFPLTVKSFKATMAMKTLQPKIAELQARFKSDPKRLNFEMMNLYKNSGTNPFGGCLPMLLQLPIFWALFHHASQCLRELRGAPFVGWIHDLSTPDRSSSDWRISYACVAARHGRSGVYAATACPARRAETRRKSR